MSGAGCVCRRVFSAQLAARRVPLSAGSHSSIWEGPSWAGGRRSGRPVCSFCCLQGAFCPFCSLEEVKKNFFAILHKEFSLSDLTNKNMLVQEDEGQAVNAVAWDYFLRTIRNVDGLKRYQGLKAAMRMVITQVSYLLSVVLPCKEKTGRARISGLTMRKFPRSCRQADLGHS
jgi:hypothetical protein